MFFAGKKQFIQNAIPCLLAGFLAISSCTTPGPDPSTSAVSTETLRPLLNSERIRQKFSSYGIEVLRDDEQFRVSNLYSLEAGSKITRTLAIVIYPKTIPTPMLAEHLDIKNGQSIGEVFKSAGWTIDKQNVYFGEIAASPEFALVYTSMGLVSEAGLAVHIYQMWVSKNGSHLRYATITEVHHPDYLDLNQLQEVYGVPIVKHESGIDGIQNTLDAVINVMETYRSATTDCSWPQAEFDTRSVRSSETVR